jgi:hypothetical protein
LIEDANISIRRAIADAQRHHDALRASRRPVQLLDRWVSQVEMLVERRAPVVPEPLFSQIAGFLGKQDLRLYRRLRRHGKFDAARVLDVLFDAEERFLPGGPDEPTAGPIERPVS